ncbi:MFS transporter [Pseudonocardia sp. ICBG601]|uniref:MFS transporter n=1 Tax=Pseudonocardia sp. ICBG601 TaxID=2846759 RepID=UPI001CF644F3|nr:MFS transporter [Pseudonocardia sp. ICBG601]
MSVPEPRREDLVEVPSGRRRTVLAAAVGNYVEWYEFAVYGVVAAYISRAMFPADDPSVAMLNTWATYAVSFLARPVGGVLLARLGDRHGRQHILYVTIAMMSIATFSIALIPSYAVVGIAAPILLVCARLAQGIAAGGEFAGATAFLYEHAPAGRRARTVSYLGASTFCAIVSGSAVATLLAVALPAEMMQSWGWRVVFATALPLGLVGIYIRRRLTDTPAFHALREQAESDDHGDDHLSLWQVVRRNHRAILLYLGFGSFYSVAVYVSFTAYFAYMQVNGMPPGSALAINTVGGVVVIVGILLSGGLADRVGRRPLLIACIGALAVVTVPTFLLGATGSPALALLGALLFVVPLSVLITPAVICVAELFPVRVRVTAGAIAYNLTVVVGGFTPFMAVWLTSATGSGLAFPLLVVVLAVVALIVVLRGYREPGAAQEELDRLSPPRPTAADRASPVVRPPFRDDDERPIRP